jgi:hypothetical protein
MTCVTLRGRWTVVLALVSILVLIPIAGQAQVPQTISYQGSLTDSGGAPVTGAVTLTFGLYVAAVGGTPLWQETQASVPVTNGAFSVSFGTDAGNLLDVSLFAGQIYLGIQVVAGPGIVTPDPEMTPRQALTAVGYAIQAKNAETLGGLLSSEIIDAASDEVRTPISALPFIIPASGSYFVTGDLISASNGISVNADNVTIDLMGYSLIGPAAGFGIVMSGRSNVEIRNGTVRDFSVGINENGGAGRNHRVVDLRADSNANIGINLMGESHLVKDSTVANNGGSGMSVGAATTVTGSTAHTNVGTGISTGAGARVTGNTAYNNSAGGILTGFGATVIGNTAHNNNGDGISAGVGSTVTGNAAYFNGDDGIAVGGGATVSDNSVYLNNSTGIRAGNASTVTNNTALQNNGVVAAADGGGIRVFSSSFVKGNTVSNNTTNGIYVAGVDIAVEDNLVTSSTNGINFSSGGNFYANNRASGNTTDYFNGASQTDGGGNVSF